MRTPSLLISGRGAERPSSHHPFSLQASGAGVRTRGPGTGRGASTMGASFGHAHAAEESQCHIPSPPVSHPICAVRDVSAHPRRAPGCGSAFDLEQLLSRKLSVLFITGKKQLGPYKGFCCSSSPSQHCWRKAGTSQCHLSPHTLLPQGLPSPERGDAPIPGVG